MLPLACKLAFVLVLLAFLSLAFLEFRRRAWPRIKGDGLSAAVLTLLHDLRRTIQENGFGLFMFLTALALLVLVPQVATLCWELPAWHTDEGGLPPLDTLGISILFWVYVVIVALYFFVFWLTLLHSAGFNVTHVVVMCCALIATMLGLGGQPLRAILLVLCYLVSWVWFLRWREYDEWNLEELDIAKWTPARFFYVRLNRCCALWNQYAFESAPVRRSPRRLSPLELLFAAPTVLVTGAFLRFHGKIKDLLISQVPTSPRWTVAILGVVFCSLTGGWLTSFVIDVDPTDRLILSAMLTIWLLICAITAGRLWASPHLPQTRSCFVGMRALIFLFVAYLVGLALWVAPSLPYLGDTLFSLRLYTIWTIFHLAFGLMALGTWTDVTHRDWIRVPMRLLVLLILALGIWSIMRSQALEPLGQKLGEEEWVKHADKESAAIPLNWYKHVLERMDAIDARAGGQPGPFVMVTASGGGSRAALFTSLVLQGLKRERFPLPASNGAAPECTWSDRILFMSGVSGGSLALADFVYRPAGSETRTMPRNTLPFELTSRFGSDYDVIRRRFYASFRDVVSELPDTQCLDILDTSFDDLNGPGDPAQRHPDWQWLLTNSFADDMCTDFMAPLLRGVLSYSMERGESVRHFWQRRFQWLNGGHVHTNQDYDPQRPLLIFNATEAHRGNRFLMGFPALPRRVATLHLARTPFYAIEKLGELTVDTPRNVRFFRKEPLEVPVVAYEVNLQKGLEYVIDLERHPPRDAKKLDERSDLDPYVFLAHPQGEVLAEDDDNGNDLNARLRYTPEKSGRFVILASRYAGAGGGFKLSVHVNGKVLAEVKDRITRDTRLGRKYYRTLFPEDRLVAFKIDMKKGEVYRVDMEWLNDQLAPLGQEEPRLDPFLRIASAKGEILAEDDDSGLSRNALISDFRAPADGTYHILASSFFNTVGKYKLTVRKETAASPFVAQAQFDVFNPNFPYTQTLFDFCPNFRLDVSKAVRASANFPWGFQSCFLRRETDRFDFTQPAAQQLLLDHAGELLELLPDELNLLDQNQKLDLQFKLDGLPRKTRAQLAQEIQLKFFAQSFAESPGGNQEKLQAIAEHLQILAQDPHAPHASRQTATRILEQLPRSPGKPQDLYLLDGGVNDNTGIPAVAEILLHLETVATSKDPLIDEHNRKLAAQIMECLRRRGVIFLEIDSGAKPRTRPSEEWQKPLQGLGNAAFFQAIADRDRHLKTINKLLTPSWQEQHRQFHKETLQTFDLDKNLQFEKKIQNFEKKELPWMFHHHFLCNLATDRDALTAWALGPKDKAHVMATFFCEYQIWKTIQGPSLLEEWRQAREALLDRQLKVEERPSIPAPPSQIETFRDRRLGKMDRWRIGQQTAVNHESKRLIEKEQTGP